MHLYPSPAKTLLLLIDRERESGGADLYYREPPPSGDIDGEIRETTCSCNVPMRALIDRSWGYGIDLYCRIKTAADILWWLGVEYHNQRWWSGCCRVSPTLNGADSTRFIGRGNGILPHDSFTQHLCDTTTTLHKDFGSQRPYESTSR
ncbi:hypothetical protein LXL04_017180 [Taraxacum kok-saghyz]